MKVLFFGDVCGETGVCALERALPELRRLHGADLTLVNGENASGVGILPSQAERIFRAGADVITLGNHAFDRREILDVIDGDERILRPHNLPRLPGRGMGVFEACHRPVGVLVLQGRAHMDAGPDNPFLCAERAVAELKAQCRTVIVDFHADATSEKNAAFFALAGSVSLLVGTHTHVQTADERIMKGTGYITDLGMCGAEHSVVGVEPRWSLDYFRSGKALYPKTCPEGDALVCGLAAEIDAQSGACTRVERIYKRLQK